MTFSMLAINLLLTHLFSYCKSFVVPSLIHFLGQKRKSSPLYLLLPFVSLFLASQSLFGQSFEKTTLNIKAEYPSSFEWIDADNDNDLDVLVFTNSSTDGNKFRLYKNENGVFTIVTDILTGDNDDYTFHNYAFGDYDTDGDIDFLIVKFGALSVAVNNGNLTFTLQDMGIQMASFNFPSLDWLDLDGDADLDIEFNGALFMNSGGHYLKSSISLPTGINRMWWTDINNDGLVDLIASKNQNELNYALVAYINKGHEVFGNVIQLSTSFDDNSIFDWFDADQDHDLDLLISEDDGSCAILRNLLSDSGTLAFEREPSFGPFLNPKAVIVDTDIDGLPDIVIHEDIFHFASTYVYKNTSANGSINFIKGDPLASAERIYDIDVIDFNRDQRPDLFFGGLLNFDYITGRLADVYKNTTLPSISAPAIPTAVQNTVQQNVKLSWQHDAGNQTCYYNVEIKKDGQLYKSPLALADGTLMKPDLINLSASKDFTLYDLPEGNYEWSVQSFDHAYRASAFSGYSLFEIKPGPENLTIENVALTTTKLSWSYSDSGNPGFAVYRMTGNNAFTELATVPAGVTTFVDDNLPPDEHFKYFVRAVSNGAYSAPSNTVSFYSTQFVEIPFDAQLPNVINGDGVTADFDLDGDYDFGFIGKFGGVVGRSGILVNDGTGAYTPGTFLPEGVYYLIAARDFDNDGDTDICAVSEVDGLQRLMIFGNQANTFIKVFETSGYTDIGQIAFEDLNNDGRTDLLFSHTTSNSVVGPRANQLLYQTPVNGFIDSQVDLPTGENFAGKFYLSDLNGDNFTDIIFSGSQATGTRLFRNMNGRGFKQIPSTLPALVDPFFSDLDGDSHIDVIHRSYPITVYSGLGDFQFSNPKELNIDIGSNLSTKSGDTDQNGWSDLIVTDGWRTRLMNNIGQGNFVESSYQFPTIWGTAVFLTDMENDGDIDLIKFGDDYNDNAGINFFYKNQARTTIDVNGPPSAPSSVQAHSTQDGIIISWSASSDDHTPEVLISYNLWLTDANGKNWIHPETNASGTFRRRFADGNAGYHTFINFNDLPAGQYKAKVQALDAAFAPSAWSNELAFTILEGPKNLFINRILLNKVELHWTDGPATESKVLVVRRSQTSDFEVVAELPTGASSYLDADLAFENIYTYKVIEVVNGVMTSSSNAVDWNTTLLVLSDSNLPDFSGSLDVGDYTGDGKMDLLVLGTGVSALFENTQGGWATQNEGSSTMPTRLSFKFQDINGDYKLDLYEYGSTGFETFKTEVFVNNGEKTFTAAPNVFSTAGYDLVDWWDYDMDNDWDAYVLKESGSGPQSNLVLKNQGDGSFTTGYTQCGGCNASYAFFGDFDRDGDEDIGQPFENGFSILLNGFTGLKKGPFISQNFLVSTAYPVDYNGDGWLDIFFKSNESFQEKSKLFKNLGLNDSGELHFEMVRDDFPIDPNMFINWVDYDHDGDLDLFMIGIQSFLYQNQNGQSLQLRNLPSLGSKLYEPRWIDVDNDGDLDLVASGLNSNRNVLFNQLIAGGAGIQNQPPQAPTNLTVLQDSSGVYLRWDASMDDHTPESAVTADVILYKDGKAITKGVINPETGLRLNLRHGRNFTTLYLKTLTPGAYTWKVQGIDQSFLASLLSVESSFVFRPLQPGVAGDTTLYYCTPGNWPTLTAKGDSIEWFRDKNATMKIASGEFHPEESQVVYVTQTVNGLKGFSKRVKITLILVEPSKPDILPFNPLPFCEYEAGFSGTVEAQGESIQWYSTPDKEGYLGSGSTLNIIAEEKSYYVTQTIHGCESEVAELKVYEVVIESTIQYDQGRLITLEKRGDYYEWFLNEVSIPNSNNFFIEPKGSGAYVVGITKVYCHEFSEPFIITAIEEEKQAELKIFPNPVADNFTIEIPPIRNGDLNIFDANGKVVYRKAIDITSSETLRIPSGGWKSGLYLLEISDGRKILSGKIIKL